MFKLNSKKLMLILSSLVVLGGVGVGRYLYQLEPKGLAQPGDTKKEEVETREVYYIEEGEVYPKWKKLTVRGIYSIEYPPESSLILTNDRTSIGISLKSGGLGVRVSSNSENTSPKDWVDKYRPEIKRKVIKEWELTISGRGAYSFTVSSPGGEFHYTFIAADQKVLEVGLGGYLPVPETALQKYAKETLFKMLDTFQLLDY